MRITFYILLTLLIGSIFLPANAQELEEIGFARINWAQRVSSDGDYAYVSEDQRGLHIVDISDPEDPEIVSQYEDAGGNSSSNFFLDGLVYMANNADGLYIIDVSDPDNPEEVGHQEFQYRVSDVHVVGDIAYLANSDAGLTILNVADPGDIEILETIDTDDEAHGVFVQDDYAYVADDEGGLIVFDVADPEDPQEVGSSNAIENAYRVAVSGDYAYVADFRNGEIVVVDISDPENPDDVGSCDTRGDPWGLCLVGDYAFTAYRAGDRNGGIQVIDISNPRDPDPVTYEDVNARAFGVSVTGSVACLAVFELGMVVFDVSEFVHYGPIIEVLPEELDFERVGINDSKDLILTINNTGNEDLTISDVFIDGNYFTSDFEEEFVLEPETEAELTVTFTPEQIGESDGTLTIETNDPDNEEFEVPLFGIGVGAEIDVRPDRLHFREVGIDTSAERTLLIENDGLINLIVSDISLEGDAFSSQFEDEIVIEPDSSHEQIVTFTPENLGVHEGTLSIACNDGIDSLVVVSLDGTGVGAEIYVSPDTVNFRSVGINRMAEIEVTIGNEGLIDLRLENVFTESNGFDVVFEEEVILAPDESIELTVSFSPVEARDYSGVMLVLSNDPVNDELIVPLRGIGVGPQIGLNPTDLDFGEVRVDHNYTLPFTINAEGLTDLSIQNIQCDSDHFFVGFEEEIFLELGAEIEVEVVFSPLIDGEIRGSVLIESDDADNPQLNVELTGVGLRGAHVESDGQARSVTVADDLAYVSDGTAGLTIMDVADPESPSFITSFNTNGNVLSTIILDRFAILADSINGVLILNISDPDSILIIGQVEIAGAARDLQLVGEYVFVAAGEEGLRMIDVYDLERPVEVGELDTDGYARSITVDDETAYIADEANGLIIVDVSDPEFPQEIGHFNTRGWAWDVDVIDTLAYVADERRGLRIIDISDKDSPEEIGGFDTHGDAYGVEVRGDLAYVADRNYGLSIINIADPEETFETDRLHTPSNALNLGIYDEHAYVSIGEGGFMLFDVTRYLGIYNNSDFILQPSSFSLSAFPNPFNSSTMLTYTVPHPGLVTLKLFDIAGRQVDVLRSAHHNAGAFDLMLHVANLPSGNYILTMNSENAAAYSGLTLIR